LPPQRSTYIYGEQHLDNVGTERIGKAGRECKLCACLREE
jgi:hypothetical protein